MLRPLFWGKTLGIFNRLNRVLKSNINSLLDDLEAPEKKIDQIVDDMKSGLKKARKELVETLGTSKRLDKKFEEQMAEAKAWEEKAVLALQNDDDALAKEALRRKQLATKEAQQTRSRAAEQATAAMEMKDTLSRIEDLKAKRGTLAAQVRRARDDDSDTLASNDAIRGGAFSDLERMVDRVDQLEAEVEAHEILQDPRRKDMDSKFAELEKDQDSGELDDELAALKAKLQ